VNGRRLLSIYVAPRDSQITPDLLSAHWWSLLFTDSSDTVQDTLFKCRY